MKIGFLITGRLKSQRLPKKLLKDLNGQMVIEHMINRSKHVPGCNPIVLCTSTDSQDDPLEEIAQQHNIECYRGDPDNVIKRLNHACIRYDLTHMVGITADNPLFSFEYASQLVETFQQNPELDYIYTSGLPLGVNTYGMSAKSLSLISTLDIVNDTEIWGRLFQQPQLFNIKVVAVASQHQHDYRLTLDEIDDYQLFQQIYNCFEPDTTPSLEDVLTRLSENPDWLTLNSHIIQRDLDDTLKQTIDDFFLNNQSRIMTEKTKLYTQQNESTQQGDAHHYD